jgi:hypothetical protein
MLQLPEGATLLPLPPPQPLKTAAKQITPADKKASFSRTTRISSRGIAPELNPIPEVDEFYNSMRR